MTKVSVFALAMLFASGCVCTKECTTDAECGPEGMCPMEYRFCVVRPDGGSMTLVDSGMTTGDSGQPAVDAGERADAGAQDAGPTCNRAMCKNWEYCESDFDGGVCRTYRVVFTSPSNGEVFDAGSSVLVGVIAYLTDGGTPSILVPVRTSYGEDAGLTSNVESKSFTLPNRLGHFTLTAGWTESPNSIASQTVGVDTKSCEVICPVSQECVTATVDGGMCGSAGWRVSWVTPVSGLETNLSLLPAVVSVTTRDGGSTGLSMVPVNGPNGEVMFSKMGETFSGNLVLASQGSNVFETGWPGATQSITVTYDTIAPAVQVTPIARNATDAGDPDPGFEGHWKKDEKPLLRVEVDGGRPAVAGDLSNGWGGAITEVSSAQCACATSSCRCFAVDVVDSPVNAIRANNLAVAMGPIIDAAGNGSPASTTNVKVTRFKWARALGTTAAALFPVTVSSGGVVMATSSERIRAYGQNGSALWSISDAGILTTGLTVGTNTAFVARSDGSSSALVPIPLGSGQIGNSLCAGSSATFTGDLALGTGASGEVPFGLRNGVLSAGFDPCPIKTLSNQGGRPYLAIQEEAGSVVAVFSTSDAPGATLLPNLFKTVLADTDWTTSGNAAFPLLSPTGRPVASLYLDGTHVGGTSQDGIFTATAAGTLSSATVVAASANLRPAVVGAGFVIYGDSVGQLTKQAYTSGVYGSKTVLAVATGEDLSSPILGAGQRVYAVGSKGTVVAVRSSDLQGVSWVGPFVPPVSSVGQPALDVYRKSDGGADCSVHLGVLYVASVSGVAASLTAIFVDSQGLEPMAPWPKYQRDNANTGNISRSLDPWTCP